VSNIDDIPGADGIDGNGDTGVAILNAVKGSMGYILKGLCTFVLSDDDCSLSLFIDPFLRVIMDSGISWRDFSLFSSDLIEDTGDDRADP
jgi:hypothetical protein